MNSDQEKTSTCVRFAICAPNLDFAAVTSLLGISPAHEVKLEKYNCWIYEICDCDCWDINPMLDQLTRIFEPRRAELLRIALRFQAQLHIDILIDNGSHTMNFTIDHRLSTFIYEINATVVIETSLKNPIA